MVELPGFFSSPSEMVGQDSRVRNILSAYLQKAHEKMPSMAVMVAYRAARTGSTREGKVFGGGELSRTWYWGHDAQSLESPSRCT